jgi:putative FmdB family regulatory protein
MPIYTYECAACKAEPDILVASVAERDTQCCPSCGSKRLRWRLTTFAVGKAGAAAHGCALQNTGRCPSGACASCPSQRMA